ncbi:RelA/SpoT domain-containing protein [Jiangella alkaliphila]|uniref:RelA/SpoT domain-containing protein n=1 Tax=Jiangella alkaliphila TaxID=419479 RepID=A0A1H2G6C1_9ACTN|nr:RelA/SpoT domain-containing protein [Jiangella alkaliphila]SDU15152.1 hypothetical protein SAMN04488563_0319 [Jiangella alkaliphila]
MPGGESDSQRPIADGVDGLSELHDREVPAAVGEVAEHVRAELAELRRLLEQARGHVDPAMLTALDDAHRRLQDDLQRLGGDVSGVLSSAAGELEALRRPSPGAAAPVAASPSAPRRPVDDAVAAVRSALAGPHPDVAALVARLLADTAHSLDLTRALRDPERRGGALTILGELADGRALAGRSLGDYVAAHPGRGPLFAPVPSDALVASDGRSRKELFVAAAVLADPGRCVGADPTAEQLVLLDDYVRRLVEEVEPRVFAELSSLAAAYPDAAVSSRVKDPDGLVEKVRRMSAGAKNRPGRAGYRVGDVLDAVGARITVAGTADLAALVGAVVERFGTSDDGRVLDWENRYTDPKPHNPAYRVVPFILVARVGGLAYPFELQLTTQRASIAADLEHNTVYKPYVPVSDQERDRIRGMQAEAAALDQDETRNGVD